MTDIELKLISRILSGELTPLSPVTDEERFVIQLMRSERRLFASQRNTFVVPERTRREYLELKQMLNQTAEESARRKAEEQAQREADRAQSIEDKKQDRRHDFFVAAFGGAVTLLLEHIGDLVNLIQIGVEYIRSLFPH